MKCLSERKKKKFFVRLFYVYDCKPVKKIISFSKLNVSGLLLKKVCFYTELLSACLLRTFCQVKVNKLKLKLKLKRTGSQGNLGSPTFLKIYNNYVPLPR